MLYDPERDLYELLGVSTYAGEEAIRAQLDSLRGVRDELPLDDAANILLNIELRTRYDAERATHRLRLMLREGVAVFSGRTPAQGVPGWPRDDG